MLKIPDHLALLTTIKQLFSHKDELITDKQWLVDWAQKTKLLQLQLQSDAVAQTLLTSLHNDLPKMMALMVKLTHADIPVAQLQQFQAMVDPFYQSLNQLTTSHSDQQLQQNWQQSTLNETTTGTSSPLNAVKNMTAKVHCAPVAIEQNIPQPMAKPEHNEHLQPTIIEPEPQAESKPKTVAPVPKGAPKHDEPNETLPAYLNQLNTPSHYDYLGFVDQLFEQ